MKRIIIIPGILTLLILFNIGGCGGNSSDNGFKPSIDKIVFFKNDQKNKQVNAYTQGDNGVIQLTVSDYDLNTETIGLQVSQCASSDCINITPYHTEGPYVLPDQKDVEFNFTFASFIDKLPATFYYIFEFEVTDKEDQVTTEKRILEINTGYTPTIEKMIFYNKNYTGIQIYSWNISLHYSYFLTRIFATDLDSNISQYYINRSCLSTESGKIPTFKRIGPIQLSSNQKETLNQERKFDIEAIKEGNIISLIDGFTEEPGTCVINVELEDELGNTAQISRSLTLTR